MWTSRRRRQPCFLSCALSMAARPLRRRARGPARAAAGRCRWCIRAGSDAPDSCTWSSVGSELGQFTCAADVRAACPGHMAAAVWRGGRCRRQNADRLKRWLAASETECSGSVPQHAWAHHALDAYEWERLHALEQAGSSEGSSSSASDSEDSTGDASGGECAEASYHRDWGTPYARVDEYLSNRKCKAAPGELRAKGRCCAWCERKVRTWAVGSECVVLKVGGAVGGTVEHVCNSSGDCSVRLVGSTSAAIFRADQVLPVGGRAKCTGGAPVRGYQPVVTHSGRVYHMFPALHGARDGSFEKHTQVHVLDPESAS